MNNPATATPNADLTAAGFVLTSPGFYERRNVVIRSTTGQAFNVYALAVKSHPTMDTNFVGEALAMASMIDGMDDLTSSIIGDAMSSVAFHMGNLTGVKLDFGPAEFDSQTQAELEHRAQQLATLIAHAAQRADCLPRTAISADDDADDTPPEEVARRLLAGADAEVDSTTRAAMIRAAALLSQHKDA